MSLLFTPIVSDSFYMKKPLFTVTYVQFDVIWENKSRNLSNLDQLLSAITRNPDIILLPEMFNTGFSMHTSELAETEEGETVRWMVRQAESTGAVLMGSMITASGNGYVNRLWVIFPDGTRRYYDKRHLFGLEEEHEFFQPGDKQLVFSWQGWKIMPLICYDLRFPVWSRNTMGYDLLTFHASWPSARINAWETLLKVRAIENQSYVIGVNRVGKDGNGLVYNGASQAIDPLGKPIDRAGNDKTELRTIELSAGYQATIRNEYPFLRDGDSFTLH